MEHALHYTVEQATAALGWARERMAHMRAARGELGTEEARGALRAAAEVTGGGYPGRAVVGHLAVLYRALAELRAMEIVVRDLDRELVDFPALRDGQEVYLCWQAGEDAIAYWHEPDAGFAGRRPL